MVTMAEPLGFEAAFPIALRIGRAYAARYPHDVDVDSVVFEALWTAVASGKELSLAYLKLRIRGAVRDEMRALAFGSRRLGYVSPGAFVGMGDALDLTTDQPDPDEALDRMRLLERMPAESRFLVAEFTRGKSQASVAADLRVSAARVSQVMSRVAQDPYAKIKIPGRVDLSRETKRILREETARHAGGATTYRESTAKLGPSGWNWITGAVERVSLRAKTLKPSPVRDAVRVRVLALVEDAFRRNGGRFPEAAKALSVSPMTAYRWSKLLPAGIVEDRCNRRPDVSNERIAEMRSAGQSLRAVADALGINVSTVKERMRRMRRERTGRVR